MKAHEISVYVLCVLKTVTTVGASSDAQHCFQNSKGI